jgi:hypothetical protein
VARVEGGAQLPHRSGVHVLQGKTEVHDARRPSDDLRLPTVIRRRKGRLDLEAEAQVCLASLPPCVSVVAAHSLTPQRLRLGVTQETYDNLPVTKTR